LKETETMAIHIQVWSGSCTARITDLRHAYRRGKTCRVLRVSGVPWDPWSVNGDKVKEAAVSYTRYQMANFGEGGFHPDGDFDVARAAVLNVIDQARKEGVPEGYLACFDETIRGIDAPREKLVAGVPGKWSGSADETGVCLLALDDVNEWAEVTHPSQTDSRAYDLARKVWHRVQQAATLHEAADLLREAGCRLHGYCRLD
jgi:hypothetical protein